MRETRCELLSNEYLCKIENNSQRKSDYQGWVVNCFQMSIFVR